MVFSAWNAEVYTPKRDPFHRCSRIFIGVAEEGCRYPEISISWILDGMKTPSILLLATLFVSMIAPASADDLIRPVQSASAGRETRRTIDIAPTSGVDRRVATYAAHRLAPLVKGTQVFTVEPTGSMRPLMDDNSVLLVEPAPYASLQIGDIIVYHHAALDVMIVHRILEKRRGGFWTKGDHNNGMDSELVTEANYRGRVYGILYASRSTPQAEPGSLGKSGGSLMASDK
jgi:signal peptidase I